MSIEHCPRCSARVRVPVAAEPESWVRCPCCRAETQLSELLAAEPPLLELLDGPSATKAEEELIAAGEGIEGEEYNEFHVMAGDTLVTDEDSPTLPTGEVALSDNFFDDEADGEGASIGRATTANSDDELFGFDDNPDTAALRTTSEDGNFVDVPADGDEEFNLSPDTSGGLAKAATAAPAFGVGLKGIPTGVPRRKKKSGMLPMMIGVVGGGLFGIVIAYYGILMWAMGMDPMKLAQYVPANMQMLLPASLQDKALASKLNPPLVTPQDNGTEPMPPSDEGNLPSTEGSPTTPNSEGETGTLPGQPPGLFGNDPSATPGVDKPMTDPLVDPATDPLAMPEKPALPKPAADPLDPFGNTAPIKPELPKPEVLTPAVDPLDPLNPGNPLTPPKPEVTTPAIDPLDPLASPVKPEIPAKPEVPTPAVDPLDPLAPKPLDPLTPKPVDPLDPLAPPAVDPLAPAAMPKASEPLMLASASYAPADLEQSLTQAETSYQNLKQKSEDKATQIASYRALSHLGEVAGQLKSLGETPEKTQELLAALQTMSKKLAADPALAGTTKWTAMWLSIAPEKRNTGIVLLGTPSPSESVGKLIRTVLEIEVVAPGVAPETLQPLKQTVVSEHPLVPNNDGKVTLLGVIVEKPAEQIPGYTGPAERVIWASVGQMEKPAAPANEIKTPASTDPLPAPAKSPFDDPFGENK